MKERKFSIALRLSLTIIAIIAVLQIVVYFSTVNIVMEEIVQNQDDSLLTITDNSHELLDVEINSAGYLISTFTERPEVRMVVSSESTDLVGASGPLTDQKTIEVILEEITDINEIYGDAMVVDLEGMIQAASSSEMIGESIVNSDIFNYYKGGGEDTLHVSADVIQIGDSDLLLLIGAPVYDMNTQEFAGIISLSINLKAYGEKYFYDKDMGETGYLFLIEQSGRVLIHPDNDAINQDYSQVESLMGLVNSSGTQGLYSYVLDGVEKEAAYFHLDDYDWKIVATIDMEELNQSFGRIGTLLLIMNLIMIVIVVVSILLLLKRVLTKRVVLIQDFISKTETGELSLITEDKTKDEITSIQVSLNLFNKNLMRFFDDLSGQINVLEENSLFLSSNMDQTSASVIQITSTVNSNKQQMANQKNQVEETASIIEQMAGNIESLNKSVESQVLSVNESSSAIEEMIENIKSISRNMDTSSKNVDVLEKESSEGVVIQEKVGALVAEISVRADVLEEANEMINNIASQTNLLAMNAAIEAAHAGDAGKGFAVVADEIRKLAEDSSEQSQMVKNATSDMKTSVLQIVEANDDSKVSYDSMMGRIKEISQINKEIENALSEQASGSSQILTALSDMNQISAVVKEGTQEMNSGNLHILDTVKLLRDITLEVGGAMEEISSGINEISQAVEGINQMTITNRESIKVVSDKAGYFKTV